MNSLDYLIAKYQVDPTAQSPIELPGTRTDLAAIFKDLGFKVGAEIGVERGLFSEQLCLANPGVKLYCIDSWEIHQECPEYNKQHRLDKYYAEAKVRLSKYHCELIKKYSIDAIRDFAPNSLDFVYIDANHRFDFIMNDIIQWSKIVRPGGIISGHDYHVQSLFHKIKYDVIAATNTYTQAHQIHPWFILTKERSASWFWVKA